MLTHYDDYSAFLAQYANKFIYLCPYPGNSGDELIVRGTLELIDKINILRTYNPNLAEVILYPGGNPTMWHEDIVIWRNIWEQYPNKPFIIGPITYSKSDNFWIESITELNPNILICAARDKNSYAILENISQIKCKKLLAHDPAFYLRHSSLIQTWLTGAYEQHNLYAFRSDHEANSFSPTLSNNPYIASIQKMQRILLSKRNRELKVNKANQMTQSNLPKIIKDASLTNFDIFLDLILRAKEIHTDRLHIMICAALLNKKIFAYSTQYKKLEAVYEHSMQGWSDVTFVT